LPVDKVCRSREWEIEVAVKVRHDASLLDGLPDLAKTLREEFFGAAIGRATTVCFEIVA
jgi:hypothetical protein